MVKPPSQGRPSEQRQHPRFEVFASVELKRGDDTLVLAVKDISLGGIYVSADSHDVGALKIGSIHELHVFDALDASGPAVFRRAVVVRHTSEGVGLSWTGGGDGSLEKLVERLTKKGPPPQK